jgi:protein-disulfide isomerase
MTEPTARSPRTRLLLNVALAGACAFAGGVAGWLWQSHRIAADAAGALSAGDRAAVEKVVEGYLMAHPEILPRAMAELDRKQGQDQLASVRADVERASMGTVLGNPQGKVTLVEFTDYACTYCRGSVADVDRLIASNPDLRVVVRELPILTPASTDAAKWAIAAAAQGRYARFHAAMFESGHPSAETIAAAARDAGLDMAAAQKVVVNPATEAELVRNLDLAKKLGFTGTPSWIVGDTIIAGAVGEDKLAAAIAEART